MAKNIFNQALGLEIARERFRRGLAQDVITTATARAQSTVTRWEMGKISMPAMMLPIIARAIGISAAELITRAEATAAALQQQRNQQNER